MAGLQTVQRRKVIFGTDTQKIQNLVSYILDTQESIKQEGKRLISLVANTRLGPM